MPWSAQKTDRPTASARAKERRPVPAGERSDGLELERIAEARGKGVRRRMPLSTATWEHRQPFVPRPQNHAPTGAPLAFAQDTNFFAQHRK
jgi:hypothetical protein